MPKNAPEHTDQPTPIACGIMVPLEASVGFVAGLGSVGARSSAAAISASTTPTSTTTAGRSPVAIPHTTGTIEATTAVSGATTPIRPTARPW